MANGDALTDAFCTVWGDGDGHSMPLSPAVRVRYRALCKYCSYPHMRCHLSVTPLTYKRRHMRNVEGVRIFDHSHARYC